ncbi:hypothetical protein JZ751_020551 [Albula glossodonta]|uniref:Uncharacterized protein n=1 Tax=Albula glossodonta TaxID=121402 RepID=A0A8T2PNA1_9TELE|nr:hypothetical protein JZ751_020551 [Albula glossodonta]
MAACKAELEPRPSERELDGEWTKGRGTLHLRKALLTHEPCSPQVPLDCRRQGYSALRLSYHSSRRFLGGRVNIASGVAQREREELCETCYFQSTAAHTVSPKASSPPARVRGSPFPRST